MGTWKAWLVRLVCLFMAWGASAVQAESVTVFGPRDYVRTAGASGVFNDAFEVEGEFKHKCVLKVTNGDANGDNRVTSGEIEINRIRVVGQRDLGLQRVSLEREVRLTRKNRIEVQIGGRQGGRLNISVACERNLPVPIDIKPDPLNLKVGAAGRALVFLYPVPSSAGWLDLASKSPAVVSVPARVRYAAGQSLVPITVNALSAGRAEIVASLNGGSANGTVRVSAGRIGITSLEPSALTLSRGSRSDLTVSLSRASNNRTRVEFHSSRPSVASVPGNVVIPAGETSATVRVNAGTVGNARITASMQGSRATSHITVIDAPPKVVSLLPVNGTVVLGAATTLDLAISAIQPNAVPVSLETSPSGVAEVPSQVVVPAGQISVSINIGTLALGTATVTAKLNGSQTSAVLQVVPPEPAVVSLLPNPLVIEQGATGTLEATLNAAQTDNTEIRLQADVPGILDLPAGITVPADQTRAVFSVSGLAVGSAQVLASIDGIGQSSTVNVVPPAPALVSWSPSTLALQQGATTKLRLAINAAQADDLDVALASAPAGIVDLPPNIAVPAGQTGVDVTVVGLAAGQAVISASIAGGTLSMAASVAPPPPVVSAIDPAQLQLPKGVAGKARAMLDRAPTAAASIALASSAPALAEVPAAVAAPAGALSVEFPIVARDEGQATVTASLNGGSATTAVTVTPPELRSLAIDPLSPTAYIGDTVPFRALGTYTDGQQRDVTAQAQWSSGTPVVASIAVTGVATANAPGATQIVASLDGRSAATTLTVEGVPTLTLEPAAATLKEGETLAMRVVSSVAAGTGGLTVSLTAAGSGRATLPASIVIPAGQTQAAFTVAAVASGAVVIEASAPQRIAATAVLTIQSKVAITALQPDNGPVGTPVTIIGSNFDPNAANNEVRFNGERAIVAAASATEIKVIVPVRAGSGYVTVATPQGTAISPMPYTVKAQQDFALALDPTAVKLPRGGSATVRLKLVNTGLSAYRHGVTLAVSGLPAGVTWQAQPRQLSAGADVMLTLSAASNVEATTLNLNIAGSGAGDTTEISRTTALGLTVLPANVTTVSGRVLHAEDDSPFAGARIRLGGASVVTDASGTYRFIDPPLTGDQVLLIDGHTANTPTAEYPSAIAMPVMIMPGQDNPVLSSYIQAIDPAKYTAVTPGQAASVTQPDLPGYALNIPAGAVLYGWDGTPVTKINVRTVSVDRLPIKPVPAGVTAKTVYLYYFFREGGANPTQPIPVTMMNDLGALPGEKVDLWYYDESTTPDPNSNQWRIMGQGTVSDDGLSIVSDPGVGIPKFCCGATFPSPPTPPEDPPGESPEGGSPGADPTGAPGNGPDATGGGGTGPGGGSGGGSGAGGGSGGAPSNPPGYPGQGEPGNGGNGDGGNGDGQGGSSDPFPTKPCTNNPIYFGSGVATVMDDHSLGLNALFPVSLGCRYNAKATRVGLFGLGTILHTEWQLASTNTSIVLMSPDGHRWVMPKGADGVYRTAPGRAGAYGVTARETGGKIVATFTNGMRYEFGFLGRGRWALDAMIDRSGSRLTISRRADGRRSLPTQIVDGAGRVWLFDYVDALISRLTDPVGRSLEFAYDASERLVQVKDPLGQTTRYEWDVANRIVAKTDTRGATTRYDYDADGRAVKETFADGSHYDIAYSVSGGRVMGARVANPRGHVREYRFNGLGTWTRVEDALGRVRTRKLDPVTNQIIATTDTQGGIRRYTFDERGNRTSILDPMGNLTQYLYHPSLARITEKIDPLGNRSRWDYDANGNLAAVTDPENRSTRYTYTAQGALKTVTDPLGNVTTFEHNAEGMVVAVTDPLGNRSDLTLDAANRVIETTSPRGETRRNTWDALDRLVAVTDPDGGLTQYAYDARSNLVSVTDALGHVVETNVWDLRNRLTERKDAQNKSVRYTRDAHGNILTATDRQGRTSTYAYDPLDRISRVVDADGRETAYTYDLAGNLARIADSRSGDLLFDHDALNRVTRIVGDQGTLEYQYDALGRRTRMSINGADPIDYAYDRSGLLTATSFRGKTARYAYDGAGRLVKKTLPNGIAQAYAWDAASRLVRIEYRKADGTALEAIDYQYDANGNRTEKRLGTDSLAETPMQASYDAGNRLTRIVLQPGTPNEKTYDLAYNEEGNLTAKTNAADAADRTAYTWSARNQLTAISSLGGQASFQYDALGRRTEKTVNGDTVHYLYDGQQAIAELRNGAISAAYHPGIALDEVLARYTSQGERSLLQDALNSVIAQTDGNQTATNWRAYSPYGETQSLGSDEGNPLQYTGRENDRTGLYYYRARYYDPVLKRFISEDPIGLAGGMNVYGYVGGNPISGTDPFGHEVNWSYGYGGTLVLGGGGIDINVTLTISPTSITAALNATVITSGGGLYAGHGTQYGPGYTTNPPSSGLSVPVSNWTGFGAGLGPSIGASTNSNNDGISGSRGGRIGQGFGGFVGEGKTASPQVCIRYR